MFSLQGKVIAIAGAASGLGQAAALHLAKLGAQISVTDRSEKCLEELATELRSLTKEENFLCRVVDIRDRAAVEAWTNETVTRFGRLDGAVNAAGVHPQESGKEPIWSVTDDDWEFAQSVNVRGTLNLVRAQLRYMVDARTRDEIPTGSIIVFGSNSSVMGAPNLSAYTTSKHAILGLMRATAMDAAHYNIRVSAICPGPTDTPMLRNAVTPVHMNALINSIPLRKLGTAKEIVGLVAYLLDESSGFSTGGVHMVDGGMTVA